MTLRVRCAWENTTQGLPKTPIVELVTLTVDGADVDAGAATPAAIPAPRAHILPSHARTVGRAAYGHGGRPGDRDRRGVEPVGRVPDLSSAPISEVQAGSESAS